MPYIDKKRQKKEMLFYQEALRILKKRHFKEFRDIFDKLKRKLEDDDDEEKTNKETTIRL